MRHRRTLQKPGPGRVPPLRWAAWVVNPLIIVLATGCSSTHEQMVAFLRANDAPVSTGHYTVNPPDTIAFHAPGAGEIDGVVQRVRSDGKVALRLLGEVHVAGLTTQEIAEKIKAQLSRYYIEPDVVVEVAGFRSQQYFVFGEVYRPGPKPFTGRDTLIKALAAAQPTFLAWRSQIRLVRPDPDTSESKVIIIDLDKMVRNGDTEQNVLLQPGDIIEVPPTPLAWIGHRVRELLYPVAPALRVWDSPAQALETYDDYDRTDGDSNPSSNGRGRW
jgi:polysaccharide export outer membrane protein